MMTLSLAFSCLVILFTLGILCSIVFVTLQTGISPMPTSSKVKACLIQNLPSYLPPGNIYELGSGWGTLAIALAQKYPQHNVIGYEMSPYPYFISKVRAQMLSIRNIKFEKKDFFNEKLLDAQLIVCYLYPRAMGSLKPLLEEQLASGTWVVSNTFAIPDWKPYKIYHVDDMYRTKIYTYKKT